MSINLSAKEVKQIISYFMGILDGNASPDEIKYNTGLSDDVCDNISKMYSRLVNLGYFNNFKSNADDIKIVDEE